MDGILTLELLEDGHLHLEDLLGLLGRLQLEGHLLASHQVLTLVDLPEPAAANFPYLQRQYSVIPAARPAIDQSPRRALNKSTTSVKDRVRNGGGCSPGAGFRGEGETWRCSRSVVVQY